MLKILLRSGFVPSLVIAQVIFALVVLVNVGSVLSQQMAPVLEPTGVPPRTVLITDPIVAAYAGQPTWSYARIQTAEHAVRAMPGVISVSAGLGAPFSADGTTLTAQPTTANAHHTAHADMFSGDHVIKALGLHVLRGRAFTIDDYSRGSIFQKSSFPRSVVITEALAKKLFPDGHAVGQSITKMPNTGKGVQILQIVGVVNNTLRSQVMQGGTSQMNNVMLLPLQSDNTPFVAFTVRTKPPLRDAVMKRLPSVLTATLGITSKGAITVNTYEEARDTVMHRHKTAAWMLAVILGTVAVVVILGIAGLSRFWMQARVHAIGVRRALGATQSSILRDCHLENLLMVGIGVVIGLAVGLLAAAWLRSQFELGTPSLMAWIIGAVAVLAIGQLAVLGSALRVSRLPPSVATRVV
jgi:putative ABC transport system permease protein